MKLRTKIFTLSLLNEGYKFTNFEKKSEGCDFTWNYPTVFCQLIIIQDQISNSTSNNLSSNINL